MPGNFFTGPRGLHPTPATCFPPRKPAPPAPAGIITGYLIVENNFAFYPGGTLIDASFSNTFYPAPVTCALSWFHPGFTGIFPTTASQGALPAINGITTDSPTGNYNCILTVTWPNNQQYTWITPWFLFNMFHP